MKVDRMIVRDRSEWRVVMNVSVKHFGTFIKKIVL